MRATVPVDVFDAVDGGNVGMVQRRQHSGFALEPQEPIRVVRNGDRQDLDGDIALKLGITRSMHFAHAAVAERRKNLVDTKSRTREEGH